ncbi:MAG: hypothetical protein WC936_06470 [Candidatus Nanoarchaeia archaeon]|jgi:hypothetical protein
MDVNKIVEAVIGITVAVIVAGTVLVPIVSGLTFTGTNATMYTTLFGVVVIVVIVGIVMIAVRGFLSKKG